MGTSGSYGGSGGAWNGAKQELGDLLSGGGASAEDVLAAAAGAIDWDDAVGAGTDPAVAPGSGEIPLHGTPVAPIRISGGRGRGGGGGGIAGASGQGSGDGRRRSGGGRSRQAAARVGAGVAAAGYALRNRDAVALERLGLDLAALVTLSPRQQAHRIIDALAGTAATISDGEITRASSSMIIWLLEAEVIPTAAETVAFFATETVYQIMLTELGSQMRDGSRDGAATVVTEDELHDVIEARVASLKIEGDSVDAGGLDGAISEVLEFARRVLFERPAAA